MLLANLSGLPVLSSDSREGKSPMVDWCAEHGVIILPQYLPAGDYTLSGSNVIVDRKDNILSSTRILQDLKTDNPMKMPYSLHK